MDVEALVASATGDTPGAEVTAQPTQDPSSTPAATGGDTPGAQPGPVPYDRFQAVVGERNGFREQLNQYQGLDPWRDTISTLQQRGLTPEVLQQLVAGGGQPSDPQAEFRAWAVQQVGADPEFLDPFQQAMLQRQFSLEQQLGEFQQRNQAAELTAMRAELDNEAAQAKTDFPTLQDPEAERAAWALFSATADQGGTFRQCAELVHGMVQRQVQAELARYAAGKQQDGQVPVVTGGGAPAQYERPNVHDMTAAQRRAYLQGS